MQIYIRPELEQRLRKEKNMSGLVNQLLANHFVNKKIDTTRDALYGAPSEQGNENAPVPPAPRKNENVTTNEQGTLHSVFDEERE